MATPATLANDHKEGAPTVVLQDAYTWVSMPLDPPATASYPGGFPKVTKSIAVACLSGTLGVSFQPDGSGELQIISGASYEGELGIQGFRVRGVGGAATYQYVAQLK
jgi:hypothetical protein